MKDNARAKQLGTLAAATALAKLGPGRMSNDACKSPGMMGAKETKGFVHTFGDGNALHVPLEGHERTGSYPHSCNHSLHI